MASPIDVSKDFLAIAQILNKIKNTVDLQTDVVWTGFDNPEELLDYLTSDIQNLQLCNSETLSKVYIAFGATGTYQELSISNGWGKEYIELANQFDYHHKRIRSVLPAH